MKTRNSRRGQTQKEIIGQVKPDVQTSNGQKEDPRPLRAVTSGMTTYFIPGSHPNYKGSSAPSSSCSVSLRELGAAREALNKNAFRAPLRFGFTARAVTPQGRYSGDSGRIGFTLIELLVVVLIIGILAAVAVPQYQNAVRKVQGREVLVAIDALDKALADYYLEHGDYKGATADTLHIQIPDLSYFKYGNSNITAPSPYFQTGSGHSYGGRPLAGAPSGIIGYVVSLEKDSVKIVLQWSMGKLVSVSCTDSACDRYVPCKWVQVGTGKTCYLNERLEN